MKTITPSAELWQQPEDWQEHVARCARVCYASETGSLTPEAFCDSLIKKGHLSMFRHASRYFVFMVENVEPKFPQWSTRFVNFGKKGGITICTPHWFKCVHWSKRLLARITWKFGEVAYNFAIRLGLPAQDARGFLPLDTATRVVYTYSVFEWKHIMGLRLVGSTGKPHPNAQIAAQLIHDAIIPIMRIYGGEKAKLV